MEVRIQFFETLKLNFKVWNIMDNAINWVELSIKIFDIQPSNNIEIKYCGKLKAKRDSPKENRLVTYNFQTNDEKSINLYLPIFEKNGLDVNISIIQNNEILCGRYCDNIDDVKFYEFY